MTDKKTGPKNLTLAKTVAVLEKTARKSGKKIYSDLAARLQKPARSRARVNLWKIDRLAARFPGKTLVVPGHVLGTGFVTKPVALAAYAYSDAARKKLGPNAQTIVQALAKNPKPSDWIIIA